jgi:metal-responsive CopG/Arc/MetJ family transcriptional regulator
VKTAVSLSDELFRQAELIAKRRRISRSQLYAEVLADFLSRNHPESLIEQLTRYIQRHAPKLIRGCVAHS